MTSNEANNYLLKDNDESEDEVLGDEYDSDLNQNEYLDFWTDAKNAKRQSKSVNRKLSYENKSL